MNADARRRAEVERIKAELKRVGARNDPFSRCSFCKKDWNGGTQHDHIEERVEAEKDGDFIFIHEEKGGRIWTDYEGMATWMADAVAQAVKERESDILRAYHVTLDSLNAPVDEWPCNRVKALSDKQAKEIARLNERLRLDGYNYTLLAQQNGALNDRVKQAESREPPHQDCITCELDKEPEGK